MLDGDVSVAGSGRLGRVAGRHSSATRAVPRRGPIPGLRLLLSAALIALLALPARAHEVHHAVRQGPATVVQLSYAGGSPFSYESYEIRFEDQEIPRQVGRTDSAGRIVFVVDRAGTYRLRAFSEDGHGATLALDLDPPGPPLGHRGTAPPGEADAAAGAAAG
ncbi:MAG: hypothetical protein GF330_05140, partial [Candidatus Eisenbacteria bacterium]|nr:hypothetical protein [Candidatus Eisenbacteria bacterium]